MKHRSTAAASRAIELALRSESFRVRDLQRGLPDTADAPSRQTLYRVLKQLADDDWIRRDGHTWRPDIKAEMLAGVDPNPDRDSNEGMSFDVDEFLGE